MEGDNEDSFTVQFLQEEAAARLHLQLSMQSSLVERISQCLGEWAAVDIQRYFRGHMTRKRVRLRRKRLLHTALLFQRISRGGFARRNIKLLRIVLEQPQRKRLVMKYRYLQKGEIVVPKVAGAFLLQRFARRIPSILRVQHLRDMFQFVIRCAVRIQSLMRRARCRKRYGAILVEQTRARHERLLREYIEKQVAVRRLWRVERQEQESRQEHSICTLMLSKGLSYSDAAAKVAFSHVCGTSYPQHAVMPRSTSRLRRREMEYSTFCNERRISDLGDRDTTDSEDDSIDEELLRPQHKPVKMAARRRKKAAATGMTTSEAAASDGEAGPQNHNESGWLLRAYPGTPPPPVGKLARTATALRLARTPSEVARRILVPQELDVSQRPDVFNRLAHHWLDY